MYFAYGKSLREVSKNKPLTQVKLFINLKISYL
jgi:hypothetical protein